MRILSRQDAVTNSSSSCVLSQSVDARYLAVFSDSLNSERATM